MHEFSITKNILSIALEKAEEANAVRVNRINIVTGELSGIVDECVQVYFNIIRKETIAAEASLSFDHPKTRLRCRNCAAVFSPENIDWSCPSCSQETVEIVSGRECYVDSIEVE